DMVIAGLLLLSIPSTTEGVDVGRFELGRDLRAKFYAKFSKVNFNDSAISVPVLDIG
ncbi:hypothetical protein L195_g060927, partial [Trifolium pratense]